jgi:two-component system copper resistance phosphate regulon response regulator CusR
MKVIVVEDERKVRDFITQALAGAGMAAEAVSTVSDLLVALSTGTYDAVVLDRLLGGDDSIESLAGIRRAAPRAKVLVLSALSEVDERVRGLTEGADDYLGKPFHVSELIARLRALTRRGESVEKGAKDTLLIYDDLRVDLETQRVMRAGKRIDLTNKEFKTLCLLARHPGQIFSKAKILDEAWDLNHYPESNVVEVTIANLRSKVDKGSKSLIQSRRGVGYWLGEQ